MSELKPCPFCGGEASKRLFYRGKYRVHCNVCDAHSGDVCDTEAEAIAAWNSRAERITDDEWEIYQHSVPATDENMAKFGWVRERTCHIEHVKGGAMYDVWRCSTCGYEYAESVSEKGIVQNYCPSCGCKVVGE